ncbi:MAG: hypothetical protein V9G12_04035 [Microthrixaceae bacterium]
MTDETPDTPAMAETGVDPHPTRGRPARYDHFSHVARAGSSVGLCHERLDTAKLRVTEIVADLDETTGS